MGTRERVSRNGGHGTRKEPTLTLTDRIRIAIERDIISGKLGPGTKLDEDTIGARHGASRTPVREALRLLVSKGLIEIRPHAGAFVTTLSIVDLAEMFEAMALLEAGCAMLAARRHNTHDRQDLAAAHEACAHAARSNDPEAFYIANARFHECIYVASHNGYLVAQTIDLGNRLEAYRRDATFHPGLMSVTITEHEQIMKSILEMDEATAGKHMRAHFDTLRNDIVSVAMAAAHRPAA
jgi:DNA-binding GntR family transcriptional regulator